ncbi:RHS repeat domain-containing protein [Patescibacteria group bacterium]
MKPCQILAVFLLISCILFLISPSSAFAEEELCFIHSDHLGSTALVSNEAGELVSQQNYYPYGSTRNSQGFLPGEREYTSQVSDQAQTGLYYYNARYYDPVTGLFTQADKRQGLNRYQYVHGNPLRFVDPTGSQAEVVPRVLESNLVEPPISQVQAVEVDRADLVTYHPLLSIIPIYPVNVLAYLYPQGGGPSIQMANKEVFQCQSEGSNCFRYQKSLNPDYYERFCYDDQSIYHFEDTTWATNSGNVTCQDGSPACLNFRSGGEPGLGWVGTEMYVGEEYSASGAVIGQRKSGGQCFNTCQTPYSGQVTHGVTLEYQGPISFPGENVCDDGIVLQNTEGPGYGEIFYYCRGFGWVGFSRGEDDLNYPITDLGGSLTDQDPLQVEKPYREGDPLPPPYDEWKFKPI